MKDKYYEVSVFEPGLHRPVVDLLFYHLSYDKRLPKFDLIVLKESAPGQRPPSGRCQSPRDKQAVFFLTNIFSSFTLSYFLFSFLSADTNYRSRCLLFHLQK